MIVLVQPSCRCCCSLEQNPSRHSGAAEMQSFPQRLVAAERSEGQTYFSFLPSPINQLHINTRLSDSVNSTNK